MEKKQLTKWFYYKNMLKLFLLFFVCVFSQTVNAQNFGESIVRRVEQGETLYKYSVLYNVHIDSLKKWNNLKSEEIKLGSDILIVNYNNVDSFRYEINKLKYQNEVLIQQLKFNKKNYTTQLDLLNDRKVLIDGDSNYGIQALFEISKEKSNLKAEYDENKEILELQLVKNKELIQEKEKEYSLYTKKGKLEPTVEEVVEEKPVLIETEIQKSTLDLKEEGIIDEAEKAAEIKKDSIDKEIKIQAKNVKKEKAAAKKRAATIAKEKEQQAKAEQKAKKSELDKEIKKAIEKEQKLAYQNVDEKVNEVLVFDTDVDIKVDTSSTRYKKQQAKLLKKLQLELDTNKVDKNVMVNEVEVVRAKKNQKFKIGDEVDYVRKDKSKFYLTRAMIEIDKYNFKKADEFINKSISLNPSYVQAYMLKGDMFASMKYYDKAIEAYEKALFLDDKIAQVYYNMGNCYIYLNKNDKAIVSMGNAVAIDSTYVLAYLGRSSLYIEQKDYANALADYNKILSINKYFYPALKGRGIAQMNIGEYDKAIIDFNQFLEFDSKDVSIFYHRGMAKMYKDEIYGACLDFLSASEAGYVEADKAIKKYCD